jgi:hypothetical protein
MKTMKVNEAMKYIADTAMPDIEQVRAKCLNQTASVSAKKETNIKTNQRQSQKKVVILIAVIALLICSVTVIAMEGIIESLKFKGFEVNKYETLSPSDFENKIPVNAYSLEIKDREVKKYQQEVGAYYGSGKMEWVNFKTLGEAAKHLGFTPSELNYLPENCVLDKVVLHGAANDYYDKNTCHIYYKTYQDDGSPDMNFSLTAQYVGKNATIKMNTTEDIEKVILNNGIEALLMSKTYMPYDRHFVIYAIMWIKDDIVYDIGGGFERDEIIKMAESVE